MIVLDLLTAFVFAYLAWAVFYQLTFSVAGHFFKIEKGKPTDKVRRFAVLIPAYKEDGVIVETAKAAMRLHYPNNSFEVAVIADQLKADTVQKLQALPITTIVADFEKSTKSKSINLALSKLGKDFDSVVVLDADNHPAPDFLHRMNEVLGKGFKAVQGCRAAKTGHTSMSVLDGVSEAVNNHLLCAGHRALGLSARLAGSGMAFEYGFFKNIMTTIDALGGFDKELELKITQAGETIGYAPEAVVMDEKVDNAGTFARQRGRWLAAQYRYGRRFAQPAIVGLFTNMNVDFFNKTVQMALPPRLILPGLLAIGTLVSLIFQMPSAAFWSVLFLGNMASFLLAIPRKSWQPEFFQALLRLPLAFASTLKALTLIPVAAKSFLHTPHGSTNSITQ